MNRDDIAKTMGVSLSRIRRFCRDAGVSLMFERDYSESERRETCEYYFEHGRLETAKQFPNVKVRSIVERYLKQYAAARQRRWTRDELVELARMGGIISPTAQAKYFGRPRAFEGSIKAGWLKKFGVCGGATHGVKKEIAYRLVRGGKKVWNPEIGLPEIQIPINPIEVPWWIPRNAARVRILPRRIYLWTDIAKHVRRDLPKEHRDAIRSLARFQKWLLGTKNVRLAILHMIEEREVKKGKNKWAS